MSTSKNESDDQSDSKNDCFKCDFCYQIFGHKQSLWKHRKYRCNEKNMLYEKIKEIDEIKKEKEKLLDLATNNAQVAKKSMSTLNYVVNNFKNAPPVGLLEGKKLNGFIKYEGNTDKPIEEIIIHYYEKKKLHQLLGDLVINEYKKNNPKKQSVWTRHNLFCKQIILMRNY